MSTGTGKPQHLSYEDKKNITQPYKKNMNGTVNVNEEYIKIYNDHPNEEVKEFYKKKGLIK